MRGADVHKTYEATTRDEPRAVLRWGGLGVLDCWCLVALVRGREIGASAVLRGAATVGRACSKQSFCRRRSVSLEGGWENALQRMNARHHGIMASWQHTTVQTAVSCPSLDP